MTVFEMTLIRKLYDKGHSAPKIKQIKHFQRYDISSIYKAIDIENAKRERRTKIIQLKRKGKTITEISHELKITRSTVYSYLRNV